MKEYQSKLLEVPLEEHIYRNIFLGILATQDSWEGILKGKNLECQVKKHIKFLNRFFHEILDEFLKESPKKVLNNSQGKSMKQSLWDLEEFPETYLKNFSTEFLNTYKPTNNSTNNVLGTYRGIPARISQKSVEAFQKVSLEEPLDELLEKYPDEFMEKKNPARYLADVSAEELM